MKDLTGDKRKASFKLLSESEKKRKTSDMSDDEV